MLTSSCLICPFGASSPLSSRHLREDPSLSQPSSATSLFLSVLDGHQHLGNDKTFASKIIGLPQWKIESTAHVRGAESATSAPHSNVRLSPSSDSSSSLSSSSSNRESSSESPPVLTWSEHAVVFESLCVRTNVRGSTDTTRIFAQRIK